MGLALKGFNDIRGCKYGKDISRNSIIILLSKFMSIPSPSKLFKNFHENNLCKHACNYSSRINNKHSNGHKINVCELLIK
jgi:hypothetical protein